VTTSKTCFVCCRCTWPTNEWLRGPGAASCTFGLASIASGAGILLGAWPDLIASAVRGRDACVVRCWTARTGVLKMHWRPRSETNRPMRWSATSLPMGPAPETAKAGLTRPAQPSVACLAHHKTRTADSESPPASSRPREQHDPADRLGSICRERIDQLFVRPVCGSSFCACRGASSTSPVGTRGL